MRLKYSRACVLMIGFFAIGGCQKSFQLNPAAPGTGQDGGTPGVPSPTLSPEATPVPAPATNTSTPVFTATTTATTTSTPFRTPTPTFTVFATATPTLTAVPSYNGYAWSEATSASAMGARMFAGALNYNGKMWIISGGSPCVDEGWYKQDVWWSTNGSSWTEATASAPFGLRVSAGCAVFNNKMWVLMGDDGSTGLYWDAWNSSDGVNWTRAVTQLPMAPRSNFGCVVFNNKIWIIGGDLGYGNNTLLSDVWNSPDGINWTQVGSMPVARSEFGCVVFDGALWVIGGNTGTPANDVWTSTDGAHWTEAAAHAPFAGRTWFGTSVFNGSIWVIDGANSNSYLNITYTYPDIWASQDGADWTQVTASAPFGPRYGEECLVYNNALWAVEGAWFSTGQTWENSHETGAIYWKDIWHAQ